MELTGISISKGVAVGRAYVYSHENVVAEKKSITSSEIKAEQQRWADAKIAVAKEISALSKNASLGSEGASIFAAHAEILDDTEIDSLVKAEIEELRSAEWAVERVFGRFSAIIAHSENALIAERAADMRDVCSRVVAVLESRRPQWPAGFNEPTIVAAADLLPSEAAVMGRSSIVGLVLEAGGSTSHSAIIARSSDLPAVFGVNGLLGSIKSGDMLIVDGTSGLIIINPDDRQLDECLKRKKAYESLQTRRSAFLHKAVRLQSGEDIKIGINIGEKGIEDAECCDFVGLFRSEFLYMNSDHFPTEEEQTEAYKAALVRMHGKPVTLRTLDIGGDKTLGYMRLPKEENPFLGRRAVRLCFDEENIFRTQLRAAFRASVYGNLKIMFPMIGSIDDWRRAKAFALSVQDELRAEGIPFDTAVEFGIMIEIPSIALLSEAAAREVDFASIGTNDLCQYTCAADRLEPSVQAYYQPYSPAMVLLLTKIIHAFRDADKEISMCGEMAGDSKAAALLVGMGLRKFSMSPSAVSDMKMALSSVTLPKAEELASAAAKCATEEEVLKLIRV